MGGLDLSKVIDKELSNDSGKQSSLSLHSVVTNELENKPSTDIQMGQFGVGDSKYDTNVTPENVTWLDEIRGQKQSSIAKLGSGLANTVSQAGLDIIKDTSYLLDFENYTNFKESSEEGFHNWLGDAVQSLEDKLKLPVYRTRESEGFSPLSAGWWGDNIPSIASSLAMIIPAEGAIKGLGMLGKALGGEKVVSAIETATGLTGIADKARGVGAAIVSRQMESLMEGGQTYEDTFREAMKKPGMTEAQAKVIAGEAAATNYKANWAALVQDIPEYMILHKTFKEANGLFSKAAAVEMLKTAGLEGSEEMYQYITDKESKRSALINGKVLKDDNTSLGDRLVDYAKDGDLWTSAFFGAFGGAGFGAIGIHNNKKDQERFDNIMNAHKAVLKGDAEAYYRAQDNILNTNITESIASGNLENFKSGLNNILKSPERVKDQDRAEVTKRLNESLKQIDYAESISKEIMRDQTMSPEIKKMAFTAKLNQRSIENRLSEINNKISILRAKDISFGLQPDIQAYKEAKLTLEGIKNVPVLAAKVKQLEAELPEVAEQLIAAYPTKFKSTKDVDVATMASHDTDLVKLLTNRTLEEANLGDVKDINFKISNPETRKSLEDDINKKKVEKETHDKLVESISKAENEKDLDAYLKEADTKKITSPELIDAIAKKRSQLKSVKIDAEVGEDRTPEDDDLDALLKSGQAAEEAGTLPPNTEASPIVDESKVEQSNPFDDESKKATDPNKTVNGIDDDSKEAETRAFRYYEKVKLDGHRLLVVTKRNNPDLFNKILEQDPTGKQFEADFFEGKADKKHYLDAKVITGTHYNGIYVVLTDSNNNIILADQSGNNDANGKMVFSTLESIGRILSKDIVVSDENKAIRELSDLRGRLINNTSKEMYLPITGKSKGIPQILQKTEQGFFDSEGEFTTRMIRQSIPVEQSFGPIAQVELELPTQQATKRKGTALLSKGNQIALQGKLYAYDKNGTAFDLIPRNVNVQESDMIITLLRQYFGLQEQLVADPMKQIEKVISTAISNEKGVNEYTFGVKDKVLYVGKDLQVTPENLDASTEAIRSFLIRTKYVNANVSGRNGTQLEDSFVGPTTDDTIQGKEYSTYKEYLLSGEHPMFGTDLSPIGTVQYRNVYLKFDGSKIESANIKPETETISDSNGEVHPEELKDETPKGNNSKGNRNLFGKTKVDDEIIAPKGLDRSTEAIRTTKTKLTDFERNWFKDRFPNIPIDTVVDLIERKSFGRFLSNGRILLSDKAISGTLYHEAFHAVTQLYLTKEEVSKLYNETRDRLNTPNASDREIEEVLAEDFAVYKENGKVLNGAPKRNSMFRKILNAIKSFLGLSTDDIKNIYNKIDKGYYKDKDIVGNKQFTQLEATITGLTVAETKDVYSGMDAYYFDIAFKNAMTPDQALNQRHDIFPLIYKRFVKKEEEAIASRDERLIKAFGSVLDHFPEVMEGWKERMKSLKVNVEELTDEKIDELTEGRENDFTEVEEEKTAEDNQRSGDQYLAAHEVSTRKGMSGASKMLIRSLKLKDNNGNDLLNSLGLPQTVDFGTTYNYLLKQTVGLAEYPQIYEKIKEIAEKKPEFRDLLARLGEPSDSYTSDKMLFQRKFRQDFSKNLATSFITVIESDGRILQVDTNKQNTLERVKERWRSNLRLNSKSVDGRLMITPVETKDDIAYLQSLGIELSPDTILNTVDNKLFKDAVTAIRNYIRETKGDVTNLFDESKDSKIKGNMNDILTLESEYNNSTIELSILSTTNKTIYPISLNNGLSIIKNLINQSNSLDELYVNLPHLRSVNAQESVWLDNMFDFKTGLRRKDTRIELNLADGLRTGTSILDSVANSTKDLSTGDKFVQEMNHLLLYGNSSVIRTSDKATEHIIGVNRYKNKTKLPIAIDDLKVSTNDAITGFNNIEVKKIFRNYFKSEVKRIAMFELYDIGRDIDEYSKNGGKFTVFADFVGIKDIKDDVDNRMIQFKAMIQSGASNEEIDKLLEDYITSLNPRVDESVNLFFKKYATELKNKLEEYSISNGFDKSLTEKYTTDELINAVVVNDFINSVEQMKLFFGDMAFYKALFKRTSSLAGTKETCATDLFLNSWLNKFNKRKDQKMADGNVRVAIFEDVTVNKQDLGEYKKALVASGLTQSEADNLLAAYTKMDEGDAQGWITLDELREFRIRLGNWTPALDKLYDKAQSYNKEDTSTHLTPGELKGLYFLVSKAQYAGPSVNNKLFVPVFHKFSLMPLIPQLVEGTNMSKVLNNMTRQKVGYTLFKSGAKVGTPLNENGKANSFYTEGNHGEVNEEDYNIQTVDYRFLGLQQKSSDPHHTVTFGTQFRKLLFTGAFVNGEEVIEGARALFNEYNDTIRRQVETAKQALIKDLGLNPDNLEYRDVTKLVKLLRKEAQDRSLSDNIIDSMQAVADEGSKIVRLKYPLDSSVNKAKIDAMMMSLVNSRLIKQKVNGDAYIQGASSGFETIGKRDIGTNKALKFYRQLKDGTTSKMEVMIPMSKEYYPLLQKYGSIEALNEAIAKKIKSPDSKHLDEALITLVGYRIPTQGINSIDHMIIKKFLPEQSGQLIILPTEIVAKSGGDYDIDKLNIFRPDITPEGDIASTDHNNIIGIASKMLSHPSNFKALITPNSTNVLTDAAQEYEHLVYVAKGGKLSLDEWKSTGEKKSVNYTRQLMMTEKVEEQHSKLMLAKDMIGIGAVSNVFIPLAQAVKAHINKNYYVNGKLKSVNVRFPHHLVSEGDKTFIRLSEAKDVENGNDIQEVNSQIINATVDAANSPGLLAALGMNKDTLSVYSYLNMMGVPFKYTFYMMKQPIIQKYMRETSINKSAFVNSTSNPEPEFELVNRLLDEYNQKIEKGEKKGYREFNTIDDLKKYSVYELSKNKDKASDMEFYNLQIQIMNDFLNYKREAMLLSDAIRSVNHDTAGIGENLESVDLKLDDIAKVEMTAFVDGLDRIKNETAIGAFDQNQFVKQAYSQFYATKKPEIARKLKLLSVMIAPRRGQDKLRLATLVNNDFINYVIQNYGYTGTKELQAKLFKGDNSVAKRIAKLHSNPDIHEVELADNLIIQELQPIISNEKTSDLRDNVRLYTKRFDSFTANQLTEAFRELKELDPELYKDIVDLGIIQSGLANSAITYLGIIPFEYYGDLFNKAFEEFEKQGGINNMGKFNYLFIANNAKDSTIWQIAQDLQIPLMGQQQFGKDYTFDDTTRELRFDGMDAVRAAEIKAAKEKEEDDALDNMLTSGENSDNKLDNSGENTILDKEITGPDLKYLEEWLEENPRYFLDLPIETNSDEAYNEYERSVKDKQPLTRITTDNYKKAEQLNEHFGDWIGTGKTADKGVVSSIWKPGDYMEIQIGQDTWSETKDFNTLINDYIEGKEFNEEGMFFVEKFLEKYDLLDTAKKLKKERDNPIDPNQLSLFDGEDPLTPC